MIPQPAVRKPSKDITKEMRKTNIPAPVAQSAPSAHKRVNSKDVVGNMGPPSLARKNTSGEYGRLFIKVVKLKDLELALPEGMLLGIVLMIDEQMYFSCTLDNGLHCVTTPFKSLQREAKIDQEFELYSLSR
jgi:hypothetical protein